MTLTRWPVLCNGVSAVMEIVYVCIVQYGSLWPPAAVEHMQPGWWDSGTAFLILLRLNVNSHTWLLAAVLGSEVLDYSHGAGS